MHNKQNANRQNRHKKPKGRPPKGQPKGRMVEPAALDEINAILGSPPYRRDMLIEYLHQIQDSQGYLSQRHLTALAHSVKIPMAEVWEVATFYDHFDCIKDGDPPPAPITIRVCDSLSCTLAGAETLLAELKRAKLNTPDAKDDAKKGNKGGSDNGGGGTAIRIKPAPCIGACDKAPAAAIGQALIPNADLDAIKHALAHGTPAPASREATLFETYTEYGGYKTLQKITSGEITPEQVIEKLGQTALRGLGGAGFPTAKKWAIVRSYDAPRLMAVNGDEGEPGTFKDRYYLSCDPHRMLEGMLIAAAVVEATQVYIYMRGEYPELIALLRQEIAKVEAAGLAAHTQIHLRRGAGAYICGEESAMLESIEGKRGLPRHRPPYVAECGLFGRPTLVNNIETLFWVRDILERGGDWFNRQGIKDNLDEHPGFRSYSVSGRVAQPGVVVAPAGSTVNQLIAKCGGMAQGHRFKAYLPGGASGGLLPASKGDIALDFGGELAEYGCFVGSHAVVVLSDKDNMRDTALNLMKFFAHESCGQCTPCRNGTQKAAQILNSPAPDTELLQQISEAMADASICGLGQAAANPLLAVMRHFPEDMSGGGDAPINEAPK